MLKALRDRASAEQVDEAEIDAAIAEHEAWKAGVMSGDIRLEEIDTEAFKDRYGKLAVSVAPSKPSVAAAG